MATEKTEIKVFRVASTGRDGQIADWLAGFGIEPDYERTAAENVVGYAAKSCYKSFRVGLNPNITKVRDDWETYFDNILRSGHGSVLEHATYTYAIEGCTRVLTAEMNRHRAGVAISERSMRYVRFDDIAYWVPHSIDINASECPSDSTEFRNMTHTRSIFREVFEFVEKKYAELERIWGIDALPFAEKKKLTSMFRRIVPMGCCTGIVYTFNLRALRHILTLRTSEHAEEEIRYVGGMILDDICMCEPCLMGLLHECPKI